MEKTFGKSLLRKSEVWQEKYPASLSWRWTNISFSCLYMPGKKTHRGRGKNTSVRCQLFFSSFVSVKDRKAETMVGTHPVGWTAAPPQKIISPDDACNETDPEMKTGHSWK
jgi:hypothetical protein